MSFTYTYKGVEHEVNEDERDLTTRGKYLEDNIHIQVEGGIKEISTENEMYALLSLKNNGKYYKYIGTTTSTFTNGSIYKVIYDGPTLENQGTYGFEIDNTILELDHSTYSDIYKSNNYHQKSTNAVVKVSWTGTTPVKVWINSYAESNYDYTIASTLNANSIPTAYNDSNVQIHTRGFQYNPRNALDINYWKTYTYTGNEGDNFIYIVYRKDGSSDSNDDRGYFVIEGITSTLLNTYFQIFKIKQ